MAWADEQHFEADWWGDCANTLGEEFKHPTYARLMGMKFQIDGGRYILDCPGKSILDIGGGPSSMLLKVRSTGRRTVVDPCRYPPWTIARYQAAGIDLIQEPAEDYVADRRYDECWAYNLLQHVQDPQRVLDVMRKSAKVIRLFDWVNEPPHPGHPHELKSAELAEWGGFDNGYWAETNVIWDHWLTTHDDYTPQPAFHGYTEVQ